MVTQLMALLSLEVWRETNSRSSWEREAVLPLHDIYKAICSFQSNTWRTHIIDDTTLPNWVIIGVFLSCNLPRVVGWPTLAMRGGLTQTKSVALEQHTRRRRVILNDTTCTANNFYGNDMNKSENSTFIIGGSRGGRRRHAPPQQDPILSFSHTFLPKSTHVEGWRPPPNGSAPPPNGKSWIRHCL